MRATNRRAALPFSTPADRGPLLSPEQVARLLGAHEENGKLVDPSTAWVRRKVHGKLRLGQRIVRWHEYDVRDWIDGHHANPSGALTAVNTSR